ncbi:MAG: divalent metal cation transporter [Phycisphaerales bacterium]|nr:divalent metal cation transporter [Phycisphaerales bacterium]
MAGGDPSQTKRGFLSALGPGILFAGAAIGVSHLVQSTRAGAVYGLALVGLVILAHLMKLPAMLFGPRYAAATGRSLLTGYRRQGLWVLGAFGIIQVGTMFTIQAAVTLVTAALVGPWIVDPVLGWLGVLGEGESTPLWIVGAWILLMCMGILAQGGFGWLDTIVKGLMLVMAVGTVVAAAIQLPNLDLSATPVWPGQLDGGFNLPLLLFAVPLVGWMPAPMDITVWHSLWSLAKNKRTGHRATKGECELDFLIGFSLCIVLALAFVVLGASLLYGTDVELAQSSTGFAKQLIGLYTESLGEWSKPLIATCAIAVMVSTTVTVLDAIPRAMSAFVTVARGGDEAAISERIRLGYWAWMLALAVGAVIIMSRTTPESFKTLVDLATTLSFLGTPLLVWFNHRAMTSNEIPAEHRPSRGLLALSWVGIAFWVAFACVFISTWFVER